MRQFVETGLVFRRHGKTGTRLERPPCPSCSTGILVAVVVAVLPADREQQARLYDRAATAVHWTATFCDRNGPTCAQAGVVWSGFVQKAQFGAEMAYELAMKYSSRQDRSLLGAAVGLTSARHAAPEDLRAGLARRPRARGI